ncbi:MAG: hypothetical protein KKE23_04695 [Nanoarchaeota archaeon]|nr:hypothetical protein [Nanoarchaeota archaeon]
MEIIGRISKGSKMDQIYLSKNNPGFHAGNYVTIRPLIHEDIEKTEKPILYQIINLPPIKIQIIHDIFSIINKKAHDFENIIITGSFLDQGFNFNDIDLLLISEQKENITRLKQDLEERFGIKMHILQLSNKELKKGMESDPLYENMLSKCVSKKRIPFNIKRILNYPLLDMHLLKSKPLIDNFDFFSGEEKYYLTTNMVAILLFIENKKISNELINEKIKKIFGMDADKLKKNLLAKSDFLKKYKKLYVHIFNLIMGGIKNEPK